MGKIRTWLSRFLRRTTQPVSWHALRTTEPISRVFGLDRGTPIDRYYIEKFLAQNAAYIKGNVLEIAESTYSLKFAKTVTKFEVLHFTEGNANATIVGDLTQPHTLPENRIDCFICTQTFNFIYDFRAAIRGAHHVLKPGGVLLATVGGLSQISRYDMERWGDFWRFTTKSMTAAFGEVFGDVNVVVEQHGNILAAVSLLHGISVEELTPAELDVKDPDYQVTITICATKI